MTEDEAIECYLQHLAGLARTLPIHDACAILRGALLVGEGHPALDRVGAAYVQLNAADDQLELLASPQLKLSLDGPNGKDGCK